MSFWETALTVTAWTELLSATNYTELGTLSRNIRFLKVADQARRPSCSVRHPVGRSESRQRREKSPAVKTGRQAESQHAEEANVASRATRRQGVDEPGRCSLFRFLLHDGSVRFSCVCVCGSVGKNCGYCVVVNEQREHRVLVLQFQSRAEKKRVNA